MYKAVERNGAWLVVNRGQAAVTASGLAEERARNLAAYLNAVASNDGGTSPPFYRAALCRGREHERST